MLWRAAQESWQIGAKIAKNAKSGGEPRRQNKPRTGARQSLQAGRRRGYTGAMMVRHGELEINTRGHGHTVDLSAEIDRWLADVGAVDGLLGVFVPGSTAAVTTIEFEDGALRDLDEALESIAPSDRDYHHDRRWGDGNGFSHLRAALLGPSLTLPIAGGRPIRGTWQQVVVIDCDNRPRRRQVVLSFVGRGRDG